MHASDDTPLSMFLIDTAAVRGTTDAANDERFVRGRIATFVSVLGMVVITFFAMAMQWPVLMLAVPLLLVGGWVYAERPRLLFRTQRQRARDLSSTEVS